MFGASSSQKPNSFAPTVLEKVIPKSLQNNSSTVPSNNVPLVASRNVPSNLRATKQQGGQDQKGHSSIPLAPAGKNDQQGGQGKEEQSPTPVAPAGNNHQQAAPPATMLITISYANVKVRVSRLKGKWALREYIGEHFVG
jgi:hypothetical protein